jgi:hypothetical protein
LFPDAPAEAPEADAATNVEPTPALPSDVTPPIPGDTTMPVDVAPGTADVAEPAPGVAEPAEAVTPPGSEQPTESDQTPPIATPEEPDIFDQGSRSRRVLEEPGGLASDSLRTWTDATGRHSCVARLAGVFRDGVVLSRAVGGDVRVAYRALSNADLQFVQRQIQARQATLHAADAALTGTPSL